MPTAGGIPLDPKIFFKTEQVNNFFTEVAQHFKFLAAR
jgi:hypothetical protein